MRRLPPARALSTGFSLFELLVVVAIIALLVGMVALSIGVAGNDREIEQELFRLSRLLELVREEALMQSRDFGLLFSESGYRFYQYDYELAEWVVPVGDDLLAERRFDEQLNVDLLVEDRAIVLAPTFDGATAETPRPQVMILSSGDITAFRASLRRGFDGEPHSLRAEFDGDLELIHDAAAP